MSGPRVIEHYTKYFRMIPADREELRLHGYRLRYQVFCREFGFNFPGADHHQKIETDEHDVHARHCLLIYKPSNVPIGYMRLIIADGIRRHLPIESYCNTIESDKFDFAALRGKKLGEYSRLAVSSLFRRRKIDRQQPYGFWGDMEIQHAADKRNPHPIIPLSLGLAGFAIILYSDLHSGLATMEPRLVNLLRRYGIMFNKIGEQFEYYGQRIPCVLDVQGTLGRLNSDTCSLLEVIARELGVFDNAHAIALRH